jgi:eukaryotic-like serine/threonine-protein kinase
MQACPTHEILEKYAAGRLFELDLRLIHEHVETCVECTGYLTRSAAARSTPSSTPLSSSAEVARRTPEQGAASAVSRGTSLGRYMVLDPLGRGGMGVVYSAYDDKLGRKVAIKLLRPDRTDGSLGQGLLQEAKVLARLEHPNIVSVHDVGSFLDQVFIAMKFIDGDTLTRWLRGTPRRQDEVLDIFLKAGEGLAAVHQVGLVHRDFKTDNVLVDKAGKPHVTDFGLAADLAPGGAELGGRRVGTPGYRSPEQEKRERADALSDQFSFCAALYEALYGELPYGARADPSVPLPAIRPAPQGKNVPGWLRRVLLRGLSPNPRDRYPSMAALLEALRDDPGRKLRARLTAAAIGASVLAVVGALAWLVNRETSAERWQRECLERASAHAAALWSPQRQGEVERALGSAMGSPDTWTQVSRRFGEAVRGWNSVQQQTCALPEADPSRPLVLECLEGRRAVLQSMSDLFASADRAVAENAINTILLEVRPSEACRVDAAREPERARDSEQADALRGRLARVRVFRSAGKFDEAIREGTLVVKDAEAAGDVRVEAEARLLVGGLFADLRQYPAEAMLRQAAICAEKVRDDELRARAAIALVGVFADRQRFEEAHWAGDAAEALVERLGRPALLEAALSCQQGKLAATKGEAEEALPLFQRCLELWQTLLAPEDPLVLSAQIAVGVSLGGGEGAALIEKVIAERIKTFGADHPEVAIGFHNLGSMWRGQEDSAAALDAFGREWAIRKKAPEVDLPRAGRVQVRMAEALVRLDRPTEAWELQVAGVRLLEEGGALPAELVRELEALVALCKRLKRPAAECAAAQRRADELQKALDAP